MTLFNLQRFSGLKSIINGSIVSDADEAVAQNVSTANNTYPILLTSTANATTDQGNTTTIFGKGVKVNPSTSVISATGFSGSTATLGAATISSSDIKINNVPLARSWYGGACSTAGDTDIKELTISNFNSTMDLVSGTIITFFLSYDHTGGNVMLRINNTTLSSVLTDACLVNGSYKSLTYLSGTTAKRGLYSVFYLSSGINAFLVLKKPD